jgi:hypothetical protein
MYFTSPLSIISATLSISLDPEDTLCIYGHFLHCVELAS